MSNSIGFLLLPTLVISKIQSPIYCRCHSQGCSTKRGGFGKDPERKKLGKLKSARNQPCHPHRRAELTHNGLHSFGNTRDEEHGLYDLKMRLTEHQCESFRKPNLYLLEEETRLQRPSSTHKSSHIW